MAKGLLWKMLMSLRARQASRHPPRLPPEQSGRPDASGTAAIVEDLERKIAPLRLGVSSSEPERINLLVPSVDLVHFFGGYITKFNLALKLAKEGRAVRMIAVDPSPTLPSDWRAQLARFQGLRDFFDEVELVHAADCGRPVPVSPTDTFIATTFWTALIAEAAVRELRGSAFVYLIQEYEPFTFPMGSWSALAEQSYQAPHYAVFSSELLRQYFRQNRIGVFADDHGEARSISFQNAITDVGPVHRDELAGRTSRRLLLYARPEAHAARNMFELGIVALSEAIRRGVFSDEWEFFGIGTIAAGAELPLPAGRVLRLLPRQSQDRYGEVLEAHDVGLSLMYTPHPSLVPIEMAAAGMTVVTNSFANKTEATLRDISQQPPRRTSHGPRHFRRRARTSGPAYGWTWTPVPRGPTSSGARTGTRASAGQIRTIARFVARRPPTGVGEELMNVLVTGGCGFIGSNLVRHLRARAARLDRRQPGPADLRREPREPRRPRGRPAARLRPGRHREPRAGRAPARRAPDRGGAAPRRREPRGPLHPRARALRPDQRARHPGAARGLPPPGVRRFVHGLHRRGLRLARAHRRVHRDLAAPAVEPVLGVEGRRRICWRSPSTTPSGSTWWSPAARTTTARTSSPRSSSR